MELDLGERLRNYMKQVFIKIPNSQGQTPKYIFISDMASEVGVEKECAIAMQNQGSGQVVEILLVDL